MREVGAHTLLAVAYGLSHRDEDIYLCYQTRYQI
jgi:hypothetical protein